MSRVRTDSLKNTVNFGTDVQLKIFWLGVKVRNKFYHQVTTQAYCHAEIKYSSGLNESCDLQHAVRVIYFIVPYYDYLKFVTHAIGSASLDIFHHLTFSLSSKTTITALTMTRLLTNYLSTKEFQLGIVQTIASLDLYEFENQSKASINRSFVFILELCGLEKHQRQQHRRRQQLKQHQRREQQPD